MAKNTKNTFDKSVVSGEIIDKRDCSALKLKMVRLLIQQERKMAEDKLDNEEALQAVRYLAIFLHGCSWKLYDELYCSCGITRSKEES